jgi:hypothetical protein
MSMPRGERVGSWEGEQRLREGERESDERKTVERRREGERESREADERGKKSASVAQAVTIGPDS